MSPSGRWSIAFSLILGSVGCARSARVESGHLAEAGTHVVATPGALTIAQRDATPRSCTLRVVPPVHAKHGARRAAKGGGPASGAGGPAAVLDVLLFRLCEARANGDLTAEQYASSVQRVLETLAAMATRPPMMMPGGGPGLMGGERMRRGGPGMRPRRGWFGPRPRPHDDDEPPAAPPAGDAPQTPPKK